ncbi:MAG: pseudaminic acid synthase [Ignavibacterium sp.]
MKKIKIKEYVISQNSNPFIIAEMSGNHNQSLERALEIVDAAANSGTHGLKLQTYTPDTMTINAKGGLFEIDDQNSLWYGKNLYELYEIAHTPWEWHKPIFDRAKEKGLIPFSTPFDETSVDFLEELDVPCYKIASFENKDIPLLKKVARTRKPVIMSTGASELKDIWNAVKTLRENGTDDIVLLKCTSTYPATPENSNLLTLTNLQETFDTIVGLSDHTKGIGAAIASIALGARVIEKHFTLSRTDGGVDSAFSIEPHELRLLVEESERAFLSLGKVQYDIQKSEKSSLRFKRSLYAVKDIKIGEVFTKENVRVIRPGDGLEPQYYEIILGKKAKQDIKFATPLNWDLLL